MISDYADGLLQISQVTQLYNIIQVLGSALSQPVVEVQEQQAQKHQVKLVEGLEDDYRRWSLNFENHMREGSQQLFEPMMGLLYDEYPATESVEPASIDTRLLLG